MQCMLHSVIRIDLGPWTCRFGIDSIACKFPLSDLDFNSLGWRTHDDDVVRFGREFEIKGGSRRIGTVELHRGRNLVVKASRQYGRSDLEFKWSPSAIRDENRERFHAAIEQFAHGGYDALLSNGWISYMEVALDVPHVRTRELLLYRPRHVHSWAEYFSYDDTTVIYVGRRSDRNVHTAYDKREQVRRKYSLMLRHPRCRLENRWHTNLPLSELAQCGNRFSGLLISSLAIARSLDASEEWHCFLDRCERVGVQRAVATYSHNLRRRYLRLLEMAREEWWQPDLIWSHWPNECEAFNAQMRGLPQLAKADFFI